MNIQQLLARVSLIAYVILGVLHVLTAEYLYWHHTTKPLLMPALALYVLFRAGKSKHKAWLLCALFFSFLGDSLLMYASQPRYFTLGLAGFFLAHVCYIRIFIFTSQGGSIITRYYQKRWWIILFSIYTVALLAYIMPASGGLKWAVLAYALVLLVMISTAFSRSKHFHQPSDVLIALGALAFVASDSLLAVDRFLYRLSYAHLLIMGTYLTAQYWLVRGILLYDEEKRI